MKNVIKIILFIIMGFLLGIFITSYLSMKASSAFLNIVRLNYLLEQRILAVKAKNKGKINNAIIYYSNLVNASSTPGLNCFNKSRKYWSLFFPFSSNMLSKFDNVASIEGKKMAEGINRAMLADVLEKAGRDEQAKEEYRKASILLKCGKIEKVKDLIKEQLKYEEKLLKLRQDLLFPRKNRS